MGMNFFFERERRAPHVSLPFHTCSPNTAASAASSGSRSLASKAEEVAQSVAARGGGRRRAARMQPPTAPPGKVRAFGRHATRPPFRDRQLLCGASAAQDGPAGLASKEAGGRIRACLFFVTRTRNWPSRVWHSQPLQSSTLRTRPVWPFFFFGEAGHSSHHAQRPAAPLALPPHTATSPPPSPFFSISADSGRSVPLPSRPPWPASALPAAARPPRPPWRPGPPRSPGRSPG